MKRFDLVAGNPPFSMLIRKNQDKGGKLVALWPEFIKIGVDICKPGGFVSLIHPVGWRDIDDPRKLWEFMVVHQIHLVRMNGTKTSNALFGVDVPMDIVLIEKNITTTTTRVIDIDGNSETFNLGGMNYLLSAHASEMRDFLAKPDEETVTVIRGTTATGKQTTSQHKKPVGDYIHPAVTYVPADNKPLKCVYSSIEGTQLTNSKVIFANGQTTCVYIDSKGEYGLTEYAKAIVDDPQNLKGIKQALETPWFSKMIVAASCEKNSFPTKLLRLLRKDFYLDVIKQNKESKIKKTNIKINKSQNGNNKTKTKIRTNQSAEFFTPTCVVEEMIEDISNIRPLSFSNTTYSVLDPACGSGQFIMTILNKKVDQLSKNQDTNNNIKQKALSYTYGVDIMASNIADTIARIVFWKEWDIEIFTENGSPCHDLKIPEYDDNDTVYWLKQHIADGHMFTRTYQYKNNVVTIRNHPNKWWQLQYCINDMGIYTSGDFCQNFIIADGLKYDYQFNNEPALETPMEIKQREKQTVKQKQICSDRQFFDD